MRGSHAPALRTIVRRTLRAELKLGPGARVLCACSGGPDSNAMLHVLASLSRELGLTLVAHGVDHGLRAQAASELMLAAELARSLGVPFETSRVPIEPGSNLMARARVVRYAALREAAERAAATWIATAHTADDRAETVLLRLLRGSGARGLAVLPPASGDLLRPLVRATRAAVLLHLERHGIAFASDPTNLDTRYARARLRREVLPLLLELSPRIVDTLVHLADELQLVRAAPDPLADLGRQQREQARRALRDGRSTRVLVAECKEVLLAPGGSEAGSPAVRREIRAAPLARRRRSKPPQSR